MRFIATKAGKKGKEAIAQVCAELIQDEMESATLPMFRQVYNRIDDKKHNLMYRHLFILLSSIG